MKTLLLSAFLVHPLIAKPRHSEKWYQGKVAAILQGRMEVNVSDGRIDVLTATHAIEVEFASKWKQSIGQALWYSMQTGRSAGIVLVIEDEKRDLPYAIRLESIVLSQRLPVKVWRYPSDFLPGGAAH